MDAEEFELRQKIDNIALKKRIIQGNIDVAINMEPDE